MLLIVMMVEAMIMTTITTIMGDGAVSACCCCRQIVVGGGDYNKDNDDDDDGDDDDAVFMRIRVHDVFQKEPFLAANTTNADIFVDSNDSPVDPKLLDALNNCRKLRDELSLDKKRSSRSSVRVTDFCVCAGRKRRAWRSRACPWWRKQVASAGCWRRKED
eukprot:51279-Hanusia_phi.AAC.3